MTQNSMLDVALEYSARGWAVFPLKVANKQPAIAGGFKEATLDGRKIKKYWNANPRANIGIATGKPSGGLLVIDIDVHDGTNKAIEWCKRWEQKNELLPETRVAKTGSGGYHYYYEVDREIRISSNPDIGVDIRCDGGYIVAPPSIHPNGNSYQFINDLPIAQANEAVYKFVEDIQKKPECVNLNSAYELPEKVCAGGRNNELFKFACSLQAKGKSDEDIWTELELVNAERVSPPLHGSELKAIYKSALTKQKGTPRGSMPYELVKVRDRSGKVTDQILPSLTNLVTILQEDNRLKDHFYYDVRSYTKMVKTPLPELWDTHEGLRQFRDSDVIEFKYFLENLTDPQGHKVPIFASSQTCSEALEKVSINNPRNVVAEWLDSLEWDGEERMDYLLGMFLGSPMTDYEIEVIRVLMYGAIARAYNPGTKFDYMPVLVGKQGIGKSYFLRMLAHSNTWFLDNLSTMEGDGAIEKLRGMWFVEVAELASIKKDKIETIKAFITQTNDVYRPKYGRETVARPRGCVFCGTTNSYSFLSDLTGNRRFLPLEVGVNKPTLDLFAEETPAFFSQAWAEAVYKYKNNKPKLILSRDAQKVAEDEQERYTEENPAVGRIEAYLDEKLTTYLNDTCSPTPEGCAVCGAEIYKEVFGIENPKRYEYNDLANLINTQIDGWHREPRKLKSFGKYGRQRYFVPELPDTK